MVQEKNLRNLGTVQKFISTINKEVPNSSRGITMQENVLSGFHKITTNVTLQRTSPTPILQVGLRKNFIMTYKSSKNLDFQR